MKSRRRGQSRAKRGGGVNLGSVLLLGGGAYAAYSMIKKDAEVQKANAAPRALAPTIAYRLDGVGQQQLFTLAESDKEKFETVKAGIVEASKAAQTRLKLAANHLSLMRSAGYSRELYGEIDWQLTGAMEDADLILEQVRWLSTNRDKIANPEIIDQLMDLRLDIVNGVTYISSQVRALEIRSDQSWLSKVVGDALDVIWATIKGFSDAIGLTSVLKWIQERTGEVVEFGKKAFEWGKVVVPVAIAAGAAMVLSKVA